MTRPLIVSWGELLWDLFPDGARLGGAAANLAYHAAKLGARALLVSAVGNDELGQRAVEFLSEHGVDVRFVSRDPEHPTGTVNVSLVDGEPRFRIGQSAAWDRIAVSEELALVLERADAFCFGTLAQRTQLGSTALRTALTQLPSHTHRVVDLNLRPPHVSTEVVEVAIGSASVVKMNEREAELAQQALGANDLVRFLRERRGVEHVAITRGSLGASLHCRSRSVEHAGFPVAAGRGDAVGAGDAFTAVLALELCRGTPPETLLARANRYAAFVASEPGGMPAVPAEILESVANTSS